MFETKWRIPQAIILAALFTGAYGLLVRQFDHRPKDVAAFWINKISWRQQMDLVVIGDSRVNRGVAPSELKPFLPERRSCNFGFSGQGFDGAYLDAVERVLDLSRPQPIVVIGLSPRSLTASAILNNGHSAWSALKPLERWNLKVFSDLELFLQPCNPLYLLGQMWMDLPKYREEPHPDGWAASARIPEDVRASEKEYLALFQKEHVVPEAIDRLASRIHQWNARGLKIFVFRTPVAPNIRKIEDEMSGFKEDSVREKLAAAGAAWLAISAGYPTYDGNHLNEPGARKFSADLGKAIATRLVENP